MLIFTIKWSNRGKWLPQEILNYNRVVYWSKAFKGVNMNKKNKAINPSSKKILIGGTVRNGGQALKDDVLFLQNALSNIPNKHWFIVESDSSDNTHEILRELEDSVENFRFISLGSLSKRIAERTKRIAYCRNVYLKEFDEDPIYADADYLITADLDGVNNCITQKSFDSCWENDNWDVVTANQWGPYYDVFALRHPLWSPNNCWDVQKFLAEQGFNEDESKFVGVYSRMIQLPEEGPWIEVDSAFGGLAIYKMSAIKGLRYEGGTAENGAEMCEHVPFHQKIKERGGRIFINPRFINAELTDHSKQYLEWKQSR